MKDYQKEFLNCLKGIDYSKNRYIVFTDFLEISSIALQNKFFFNQELENRYFELIDQYKNPNPFCDLLAITALALEEKTQDFLGNIYMFGEFGNKHNGQFFTPYHISEMMAKMTIDAESMKSHIEKQGFISVSDPCCGSACMIIAASDVVKEIGYNPQEVMWFQGIDIDNVCCQMAYIQTSLLGLSGEILNGNTITMEMWKRYVTPMSIFNIGKFQKQYEQTKTEEIKEEIKVIPERINNEPRIKIEQLSLFS